ncbi:MAG TPA: carbon-nitrogen hydrolase family protein [Chthoniobacteraceae bacterium]|nr:carbon-nitrogen hydrolase family protein [Chthoniobacteraceae bacterium]
MNIKTIAAIALSNRDYPDLKAKLEEAARWVRFAARQGADLAVLPEALNHWRGDGPGNPLALSYAEAALDDWQNQCAILLDAARESGIAVTVPIRIPVEGGLANLFFLVRADGSVAGSYQKLFPVEGELLRGMVPGKPGVIEWEGLKVGGAICFDTNYPEVFEQQAALGAELFLVPSLWPGGTQLNYHAWRYSVPIAIAYPAWSRIIDITGADVAGGGYRNETLRFGFGTPVVMARINFARVQLANASAANRDRVLEAQEYYGDAIEVLFDQPNCMYYLESRQEGLGIPEILARFGLEERRAFLRRCGEMAAGSCS